MKRLMGGVRGHRRGGVDGVDRVDGDGGFGQVSGGGRSSVFGRRLNRDVNHVNRANHSHSSAVSAPSVQVRPKGEAGEREGGNAGEVEKDRDE